ncbi:hypothetical protein ACLOJK_019640 [Asimina triloba]
MPGHTAKFCTAAGAPGPQQPQNQNRPTGRPAARQQNMQNPGGRQQTNVFALNSEKAEIPAGGVTCIIRVFDIYARALFNTKWVAYESICGRVANYVTNGR